jgi:hypothetical protein
MRIWTFGLAAVVAVAEPGGNDADGAPGIDQSAPAHDDGAAKGGSQRRYPPGEHSAGSEGAPAVQVLGIDQPTTPAHDDGSAKAGSQRRYPPGD